MQATYWQALSDKQLTRWVERIYDRMAAGGGASFGIDRHGLANVLQAIADVCNAKATHIQEAWQDKELSRGWLRVERRLDTAIREAKSNGLER